MKILQFLYSLYLLLLWFFFMPFAVLAFILNKIFVPYKDQIKWVYRINASYMSIWEFMVGIRLKYYNLEVIDHNQTYIVIANHNNIADIVGISHGCKVYAKPLFKKEISRIPFLGWLFSLSAIPVDRSSEKGRKESLQRMRNELAMGVSIFIFPEGTRNRTEEPLKKFHHGAFTLAIEAQTPILPMVLIGMRKISKPTSLLFRPSPIHVHYLPPVPTKGLTLADMDALRQKCYDTMRAYIIEHDDYFAAMRQ